MKEFIDLRDYLFSVSDVGDWEGEEEAVADKLNEMLHLAWALIPDDTPSDTIEHILNGIWEEFRGETVIVETELDDLLVWTEQYIQQKEVE